MEEKNIIIERKINMIEESLKNNTNLTDSFKANVKNLVTALIGTFPDYDYSNLSTVLSNLNILVDNAIEGYSKYDRDNNVLSMNLNRISEDRIDVQHLFVDNMLEMQAKVNTGYEGFQKGLIEEVSTCFNSDDSMKPLNVQALTLLQAFSNIADPSILAETCMTGSIANTIMHLDTMGISKEEFDGFCTCLNNLNTNATAFAEAEVILIDMFNRKLNSNNNDITMDKDSALDCFNSNFIITSRNDLITLYPYHDFSNLKGFEDVKRKIEEVKSVTIEESKVK